MGLNSAPTGAFPDSYYTLLFVRFMSRIDEALIPTYSYFTATTAAYAAGLAVCFTVNEITGAGQPALLYLDPACVGTALAVGAANAWSTEGSLEF